MRKKLYLDLNFQSQFMMLFSSQLHHSNIISTYHTNKIKKFLEIIELKPMRLICIMDIYFIHSI